MPWRFFSVSPQFNEYSKDIEKINVVFSNPAVLKVFTLQCDLFSLAKVYVYRDGGKKDGQLVKDDPALDRLVQPNPMQGTAQWLWDYMFWKMVGNAIGYFHSDIVDRDNAPMYWLEHSKIEWPLALDRMKDKLFLSKSKLNELDRLEIKYRYEDGTIFNFDFDRLGMVHDLTNGVGNWFKGYSRIDALYKIISNSECALDSKNINVRYTGKFLVAGSQDPADVTKLPMSKQEKEDIEQKINGDKQVHAVKSMVDIKRFVDDLRVLPLDEAFLADYFFIGSMYGIPKDILEAYLKGGSTFENQEKSMGRHVAYTLEPAGEALSSMLGKRWEYADKKKKVVFSWDHLPFTQVFEKDRVAVLQTKANIFVNLSRAGVNLDEINSFLDTDFSELKPVENENPNKKGA